jgi:hypothetical protein
MTLNLAFFTPWLDNVEDPIPVTPTIDRDYDDADCPDCDGKH